MADPKPKLHPQVRFTSLGEEGIVIAQAAGFAHVLNRLGSFVFPLFDGRHSVSEIVGEMVVEFAVEEGQAREDLEEFLRSLEEQNLITWEHQREV